MHQTMFDIAGGSADSLMDEISESHAQAKRKYGFIKWWYECIKQSDAILVLNYDKRGIQNYVGGNTLMEMGFAYVLDKKIFLLHDVPTEVSYADEIQAMVDKTLNDDLAQLS